MRYTMVPLEITHADAVAETRDVRTPGGQRDEARSNGVGLGGSGRQPTLKGKKTKKWMEVKELVTTLTV